MSNTHEQDQHPSDPGAPSHEKSTEEKPSSKESVKAEQQKPEGEAPQAEGTAPGEGRPIVRQKAPGRHGARGTAAMDPQTRQEVARKGGLAVSRNKQHMAEIGRKGGQSVSKNREHMA